MTWVGPSAVVVVTTVEACGALARREAKAYILTNRALSHALQDNKKHRQDSWTIYFEGACKRNVLRTGRVMVVNCVLTDTEICVIV